MTQQTSEVAKVFKSWAEAKKEENGRVATNPDAVPDEAGLKMVEELTAQGVKFPLKVMREAIGKDAWDSIMLDAMHKRALKGYDQIKASLIWPKLVSTRRAVADFRTQYVVQTGDFTTLTAVTEGGAYFESQFSDDRASYTVAKYGNTFAVTMESMTNDDMGVFGTISERMGGAAARTIEQFVVSTCINANPTAYDGTALFHANHSNYLNGSGSYPLNEANLESAKQKLMSQTDMDGNYLNIPPRFLLVNPAQYFTALRLVQSPDDPSTANRAINVHKGSLEVLVSNYVTSGYWYLIGDPSVVETIELGFLGGREAPEVFEEAPNAGHAFAYDERRWKVRLIFGGVNPDYRGFVGCNF